MLFLKHENTFLVRLKQNLIRVVDVKAQTRLPWLRKQKTSISTLQC